MSPDKIEKKIMKRKFLFLPLMILFAAAAADGQSKGTVVEKEIKFAKGKTSAIVKGTVESRIDSHIFHVKANEGQTLKVVMTSPKPLRDAHLCLVIPGGEEPLCEKRNYTLKLPKTGDYEIYIEAIREPIRYVITVSIK